jgi:putative transcriptional regulator
MALVRYKRGEVPGKMTPVDWARLDAMTPEEIEQNAIDDPDNPPLTDEEIERAVLARDIRQLRQSTGLSQEKFAARFHIHVARVRDWEQGRHMPDSAMRAYLRVIQDNQKAVEDALARAPALST